MARGVTEDDLEGKNAKFITFEDSHVNLMNFRSMVVTSDFKMHDSYGSLIKGLEVILSE